MLRLAGGPWAGVLVGVSALLLLSMGGAIVAAPVTVPLLCLVARAETTGPRLRAAAVAGLTVAEIAWAATYLAVAETSPWVWLLPIAAGLAAANSCRSRVTGDRQPRPRLGNDIVRP